MDLPEPVEPTTSTRRLVDDALEDLWQLQFFDGGDFALDGTDDHGDLTALLKAVDPEAADFVDGDGHVVFQLVLEHLDLVFIHQRIGNLLDHTGRQIVVAKRVKFALDLDVDGGPGTQEKVRRVFLAHQFQEIADIHKSPCPVFAGAVIVYTGTRFQIPSFNGL